MKDHTTLSILLFLEERVQKKYGLHPEEINAGLVRFVSNSTHKGMVYVHRRIKRTCRRIRIIIIIVKTKTKTSLE